MGIGIKELIVILLIVMLVFGTKKIRSIGGDVGGWIKDFRKALKDGAENDAADTAGTDGRVIDSKPAAKVEKDPV